MNLRTSLEYYKCSDLTEIIFGSALTTISFSGALGGFGSSSPSAITTLRFKSTTPPSLSSSSAFHSSSHPNLVHIYVPAASVSTYQTATNWSQYASLISAERYPETLNYIVEKAPVLYNKLLDLSSEL